MSVFNLGEFYTRKEISKVVGGGVQIYMPHLNNKVRCVCIQAKLNPSFYEYLHSKYNLPENIEAVLIGKGEGIEHAANLIKNQPKEPLPTFLKKEANQWEYIGEYMYFGHTGNNKSVIAEYAEHTERPDEIVDVVFLQKHEKKAKLVLVKKAEKKAA